LGIPHGRLLGQILGHCRMGADEEAFHGIDKANARRKTECSGKHRHLLDRSADFRCVQAISRQRGELFTDPCSVIEYLGCHHCCIAHHSPRRYDSVMDLRSNRHDDHRYTLFSFDLLIAFVFEAFCRLITWLSCAWYSRATLITAAGTAVLGVAAALDPVFSLVGVAVTMGGKVTSMCNLGGAGGTFLANLRATLWVRLQMICIGRTKARANAVVQKQRREATLAEKQKQKGEEGEDFIEALSENEWLSLVQHIHYASKVYKRGMMNPGYKERYLVLKEGKLWWYKISDLALDEFDKYDVTQSEPLGSWSLYGNEVKKMDAHEDSYHNQETGHNKGFMITNADGVSRSIMLHQESTRDKWVKKIRKVIKLYKHPPRAVEEEQVMCAQPDYDKDEMDLPAPYASFSIAGSFLDRRQNLGSFRKPGILSKGSWKSRKGVRDSFTAASNDHVGDPVVEGSLAFRRPPDYWNTMDLPAPARPRTPPLPPGRVVTEATRPPMIRMNGNSPRLGYGPFPRAGIGAAAAGAGIMAGAAAGEFNRSAFILNLYKLRVCQKAPCMLAFRRIMSQNLSMLLVTISRVCATVLTGSRAALRSELRIRTRTSCWASGSPTSQVAVLFASG